MSSSTAIRSTEQLRTWLTQRIATHLEVPKEEVDTQQTFESQGLDSMSAMTLCDEIEELLDIEVEPTLAWDHPTIDTLAAHLSATAADTPA